jgi:hypothetical protein
VLAIDPLAWVYSQAHGFGPSAQGMAAPSPGVYSLGREGLEEGRDGKKKNSCSQSLDLFSL